MTFADSPYTLHTEGMKYFISFQDSAGCFQRLEVTEAFYLEFQQMERRNRNLQQSDWRHKEHSELTEQTLYKRARIYPKNVDELIIESECSKLLHRTIASLSEIQRRRFLLYYEYDYTFREIGAMENCTASAAQLSVAIAREKIKVQMEKYLRA